MSTLYLVATPIGNLGDITSRATQILRDVDLVYAEDSRVTQRLLTHLGIDRRVSSYHDHNKERVTAGIVESLRRGLSVAVVTDAGTPGIADPAFYLVREALRHDILVVPIPGPCAVIAALIASGLPTDRFAFENFIPPKKGKRRTVLERLLSEQRTIIAYESPHRIEHTLRELEGLAPLLQVVVARELTKLHEQFLRGTPRELIDHFEKTPPRGEIVLLFNPRVMRSEEEAISD
jgi:16S rRNA (cytidine1402-2'-O)-methyltransferase